MKTKFEYFKRLLFESMIDEDKNHIIDKLVLPDLKNDPNDRLFNARRNYKNILKAFFYKYPNYENRIDWNKWKTLTKAEFDAVMELPKNSNRARREKERRASNNDYKGLFKNVEGREFKIIGENDNWLFVAPLNYMAAIFCNSKECGGGSAKWCIGYEEDSQYWNQYISEGSKFIMAFSKHFNTMPEKNLFTKLKFMIQATNDDDIVVWDQTDSALDTDITFSKYLNHLEKSYIYGLFDSISFKEYEIQELDIEGFVTIPIASRVNNGTYIPPKNAVGIDFSHIPFTVFMSLGIRNIFIPNHIMVIAEKCFNFSKFDKVIFEYNRSKEIEIGNFAFEESDISELRFPNKVNFMYYTTLTLATIKELYLPIQYKIGNTPYSFKMFEYKQSKLSDNENDLKLLPIIERDFDFDATDTKVRLI